MGAPRIPAGSVIAAALLALAGCASMHQGKPVKTVTAAPPQQVLMCPQGQSRATEAELVFGRYIGQTLGVTEADWTLFLDQDVTPRFPDGLSVMDVAGQWRASDGTVVKEPSKVLYLVLDGGPDDPAKVSAIRDAYKRRFHQDSVLLVTRTACVSF